MRRAWFWQHGGRSGAAGRARAGEPRKASRAVAVNARWAKPLDEDLILRLARATGCLVTIEDGAAMGGFGSAVAELLHAHDLHDVRLKIIGLPDIFVEHGAPPSSANCTVSPAAMSRRLCAIWCAQARTTLPIR